MDFAALPPEINSGRMYAGPGSEPMLAAAGAWDSLAAELYSAATYYQSVDPGWSAAPGWDRPRYPWRPRSHLTWRGSAPPQHGGRHMGTVLEGLGRLPLVLGKGGLGSVLKSASGLDALTTSPLGESATSVGVGQASSIGGVSVPRSWASAATAVKLLAHSEDTSISAVPASAGLSGGTFGQSLAGALAGRAVGGAALKALSR